jgi:hypothetical protein
MVGLTKILRNVFWTRQFKLLQVLLVLVKKGLKHLQLKMLFSAEMNKKARPNNPTNEGQLTMIEVLELTFSCS